MVGRAPIGSSGDFSLVFTTTPSTSGAYTFALGLIDENGVVRTLNVDVPVTVLVPGSTITNNYPATWHEVFQ